jgi:hypothetical protein
MVAPSAAKDYSERVIERMISAHSFAPDVFETSKSIDVDNVTPIQNRIELLRKRSHIHIKSFHGL